MDAARLAFVPDDAAVLDKLRAAVAAQGDPPIAVDRLAAAVLAFECATWDMSLRSRAILPSRTCSDPSGIGSCRRSSSADGGLSLQRPR